jgi:hypothetical protein
LLYSSSKAIGTSRKVSAQREADSAQGLEIQKDVFLFFNEEGKNNIIRFISYYLSNFVCQGAAYHCFVQSDTRNHIHSTVFS